MKETLNVNIGSEAFTIDDDAYRVLSAYLDDIRSRLPQDETETMQDIETRLAEIFRERVPSPLRVVTLAMVREAMDRMGPPEVFGQCRDEGYDPQRAEPTEADASRRLYRSRSDRAFAGICGGLGRFFDIDPTLIRLVTFFLVFFGGLSLWVYILLWIIVPEEPVPASGLNHKKHR